MRCRLACWLYHIQCNPALWTGPEAATADYTTPLTSRQPLKWRGGGGAEGERARAHTHTRAICGGGGFNLNHCFLHQNVALSF